MFDLESIALLEGTIFIAKYFCCIPGRAYCRRRNDAQFNAELATFVALPSPLDVLYTGYKSYRGWYESLTTE